jgi:hypothetical protein
MNGSRENRASGAPETSFHRGRILSLHTARRMLPLVQRIVADILGRQAHLDLLQPEQEHLERHKRTLSWPLRQRRYQVREEIAGAERDLEEARAELDTLGVLLLDPLLGLVGFPTIVNDRTAFFTWQPGEDDIRFWRYAHEKKLRPIPPAWLQAEAPTAAGQTS